MSVAGNGGNGNDLQDLEAWLTALESMIALVATQLPPPARDRFATALRELEETGPDLNARRSWSAALGRVRSLISE
jgi:hypothetical protein